MAKLTVGQVLHCPPRNRSAWAEYTVTKIGRKWATLKSKYGNREERCTLDTLMLDRGGYSPSRLHISREAYEQKQALNAAWFDLSRRLGATAPAGMTMEIIEQAAALLGVPAK